jgi:hypothetical protein
MIENKYFNSSNNGKPKFMPPQKRQMLEASEKQMTEPTSEVKQVQVEKKTNNDENKFQNTSKSLFKR